MQNKDRTKFIAFICKVVYVGIEQNDREERIDHIKSKTFLSNLKRKPDVICIQETWLKTHLNLVILDKTGYIQHYIYI